MEDLSGHPWAKLPVHGSEGAKPSIPATMQEFVDATKQSSMPERDILPEQSQQGTPKEVVYGGGPEQPREG